MMRHRKLGVMRQRVLLFVKIIIILTLILGCGGGNGGGSDGGGNDSPQQSEAPLPTSWSEPVLLETGDGDAQTPWVSMSDNGTAIAVWSQNDGDRYNIYANYFNGSSWESAELIENNIGMASTPRIDMDTDGNAIVVWAQTNIDYNGRSDIWFNYFDGASWGDAELLETNDSGQATNPYVAFDSNGNAMAVWQHESQLWGNRFDGESWDTAIQIGFQRNSLWSFSLAGNGSAIILTNFKDNNVPSIPSIWAQHFNGATWSSPELIENDTGDALLLDIAIDEDGRAVAVWGQFDGTDTNLWANSFDGTTWGNERQLGLISTNFKEDHWPVAVGMDASGNAITAWSNIAGEIYARHFSGSSWGNAVKVEEAIGYTGAMIVCNEGGEAMIFWGGANEPLSSNRYRDGSWSAAEPVDSKLQLITEGYKHIDMDDEGKAIAVWINTESNIVPNQPIPPCSIWASRSTP